MSHQLSRTPLGLYPDRPEPRLYDRTVEVAHVPLLGGRRRES